MRCTIPSRVDPEEPLRLSVAAALAFPDGSMTASGLRRESARGRLVVERIAGKDYTTLANIKRMRELCRVEVREPASGYSRPDGTSPEQSSNAPSGSSATAQSSGALALAKAKLRKRRVPWARLARPVLGLFRLVLRRLRRPHDHHHGANPLSRHLAAAAAGRSAAGAGTRGRDRRLFGQPLPRLHSADFARERFKIDIGVDDGLLLGVDQIQPKLVADAVDV
jgi:hypothetical protein